MLQSIPFIAVSAGDLVNGALVIVSGVISFFLKEIYKDFRALRYRVEKVELDMTATKKDISFLFRSEDRRIKREDHDHE